MTAVTKRCVLKLMIVAVVLSGFVLMLFNRSVADLSHLQPFVEQRNNLSRQLNLLQVREYLKYVNCEPIKPKIFYKLWLTAALSISILMICRH